MSDILTRREARLRRPVPAWLAQSWFPICAGIGFAFAAGLGKW